MNLIDLNPVMFRLSSLLTDYFPGAGKHFLNFLATTLVFNKWNINRIIKKYKKKLRRLKKFDKILVISDFNLGDAVYIQSTITALREYFPSAEIDFIFNPLVKDLINGNPNITNLYPVLSKKSFPAKEDYETIKKIIDKNNYDLVFSFCAFLNMFKILTKEQKKRYISHLVPVLTVLKNSYYPENICNSVFNCYSFIHTLFSSVDTIQSQNKLIVTSSEQGKNDSFFDTLSLNKFSGVSVYISDSTFKEAKNIFFNLIQKDKICTEAEKNGKLKRPVIIIYNPDTNSRFTRIPLDYQFNLIRHILCLRSNIKFFFGDGLNKNKTEDKIIEMLTTLERETVLRIPAPIPLDVYTAFIDYADIFITGDTGPLHAAAANKVSKNYELRNKTAVFSIFGVTEGRIYGYDSYKRGYFRSNQKAPSYVYSSKSRCRNYSCQNKIMKTCREVKCFEYLDIDKIMKEITQYISSLEDSIENL